MKNFKFISLSVHVDAAKPAIGEGAIAVQGTSLKAMGEMILAKAANEGYELLDIYDAGFSHSLHRLQQDLQHLPSRFWLVLELD